MVSAVFHGPFEPTLPADPARTASQRTSESIANNDPATLGTLQKTLKTSATDPAAARASTGAAKHATCWPRCCHR